MYDISKIKQNITNLVNLSETEWESVCKQCGACCIHKDTINRYHAISKIACASLDIQTRKCKDYKNRLKSSNCKKPTVIDFIEGTLVPDSCGYVEKIFGPASHPAVFDWSEIKTTQQVIRELLFNIPQTLFIEAPFWFYRYNFVINKQPEQQQELLEFAKELLKQKKHR